MKVGSFKNIHFIRLELGTGNRCTRSCIFSRCVRRRRTHTNLAVARGLYPDAISVERFLSGWKASTPCDCDRGAMVISADRVLRLFSNSIFTSWMTSMRFRSEVNSLAHTLGCKLLIG
mgnify:CR=1 FL=1